jgi:rod shape-determining protein MreD
MRIVRYAALLLTLLILASLVHWLLPGNIFQVDVFLVATVFVALHRGTMVAQLFGLAAGLSQDFFSAVIIGINGLSKTTIGFSVSGLKKAVLIRGKAARTLTFFAATLADCAIVFAVRAVFGLAYYQDLLNLSARALANSVAGLIAVTLLGKWMEGRAKEDTLAIP